MSEVRSRSIVQPGMTALGRAAERDLEAYARRSALAAPVDLTDRVMAAIEAEWPSTRRRWIPWIAGGGPARLRLAGGVVAVLVATLGGAALVAGAGAIIRGEAGPPTIQSPDHRPIMGGEPTATPTPKVDDPTTPPRDAAEPPKQPGPNTHDAVEAPVPDADEPSDESRTDESDGDDRDDEADDESDGPDDGDDGDDGTGEPDETDEPEADGDSDGADGGDGSGEEEEPDG